MSYGTRTKQQEKFLHTQFATTRLAPCVVTSLLLVLLGIFVALSMEGKSVKELRAILDSRGVSYADCIEKVSFDGSSPLLTPRSERPAAPHRRDRGH